MNVAIIGSTQGVGRQVLEQALEAGHTVRALARSPEKIDVENPRLTVVQGDVLVAEEVATAIRGSDAVIVSLGKTADNPNDVVSTGTARVIDAMKEQQIDRLIVVSSLGVGESKSQVPFLFKMLANTVMKAVMEDKERQEQLVRESGLSWTIVRPGGLADGPRTGRYESGTDKTITAGRVNRADVADFILKELEADEYVRQAPAIT